MEVELGLQSGVRKPNTSTPRERERETMTDAPKKRVATVRKPNTPKKTRSQLAMEDVTLALRARCAGFWIISRDEARTEQDLFTAIAKAGYVPHTWDIANGALKIDGTAIRGDVDYAAPEDPDKMLDDISKKSKQSTSRTDRNVWIMRDLGPWLEGAAGALTRRRLRNMLRPDGLAGTPRNVAQAIIILSAGNPPPPELSNGELTVIDWPLPDREEIGEILSGAVDVLPDTEEQPMKRRVLNLLKKGNTRDAAIDAAVGLSSQEVQTTFARSLIENGSIDVSAIAAEKKRLIDQEPAMEYYPPRPGGFDNVGGLDVFKEWAIRQKIAYSPEARAYNLKLPKGAMLIGVSGCGKTLSCQALGAEWNWPVVRLDINALKGKYVGESESRLRGIFSKIDALGQVIVYIDEVEKALEGAVSGSADGGVSADALGAILTWMQDRAGQAFVMMTANDPSKLPPEFLRKGRFDEVWWIDLPTRAERMSVAAATLRSNGRDAETLGIDLGAVADATNGFTGAEIAACIEHDAMFNAFADGGREITTEDILHAAGEVIPLNRTMGDKIARLRESWMGRARPATRPDTEAVPAGPTKVRVLDL
ncbi:AAA-ATPase [Mycobacterium phage Shida]|nr:AAA-ATPase [Mycobacterium phage Shida]